MNVSWEATKIVGLAGNAEEKEPGMSSRVIVEVDQLKALGLE